ncbi:MAG TPA: UbiA-like polyprenyltransferase [Bacteroidales bacterium]|nr:4-hydroxybenzoate octaprenyltransferase [Bacteroidales bacterium]OQB63691.1 MAG: 4-hydroxybenzoate octaprenyltransferase [Bacteroidetes bacterium ADurb.Bin145]HOU01306.1 UbiA-like polyprenyltransferase [Bacteroidales bacterium]HQG62374.1 UbiA-like polyprenyltransferase [Bacteroidales bacterium]HQK67389.1 UbiA-like polyprenyltransferase [Bacteroidales bacterium]
MSSFFRSVLDYLSLVRFGHTVFAMPFALIGFFLAISREEYSFSLRLFLLVILCMIFARNAAMGFNRLADKKYDALNPRTKNREIPSGRISTRSAAVFVLVNSVLFIIAAGLINRLTLLLSPVALIIILGYSLSKKITALCHFILGLGLSLAPVGAYISVTGSFALLPIIYSLIVLTWVSGFDIIYALQDDEFDKNNRIYSIPSVTGRKRALAIAALIHFITAILIIYAGYIDNGGIFFWTGALVFILLLIYQHLIVKPDDLSRVNVAFGTTNGIASILFAAFVIADLFIKNH